MRDLAVIAMIFVAVLSMHVYYGKDVKVVVHYDLDGGEKFGAYLFGTETIKDDVLRIFESGKYWVEKIDYDRAILHFKTEHLKDYWFFEGAKLRYPVNMTIHISDKLCFNVTSDEIPQAYIFE